MQKIALILIYFYRSCLGVFFGGACRFEPTCSGYALEAYQKHRFLVATRLVAKRLLKCRPFGPNGYDPVPCCEGKNKYE